MAININDLDDNLQPVGASLLSGNESIMDNLRELSDEELKASGGGKGKGFFFSNGNGTFFSGGKKGKGAFFFQQPQQRFVQPVAQQQFVQPVAQQQFVQPVFTQPVATSIPVGGISTFPVGIGGGFGGNIIIDINVNSSSSSRSVS